MIRYPVARLRRLLTRKANPAHGVVPVPMYCVMNDKKIDMGVILVPVDIDGKAHVGPALAEGLRTAADYCEARWGDAAKDAAR